jgi:hypothetical protein
MPGAAMDTRRELDTPEVNSLIFDAAERVALVSQCWVSGSESEDDFSDSCSAPGDDSCMAPRVNSSAK